MLFRKDLAKEFELVVKQEIKNHNDQMLATNLSINSMRTSLNDLRDSLDAHKAKSHSIIDSLKTENHYLKDCVESMKSSIQSLKDILEKVTVSHTDDIKNLQKAGTFLSSHLDNHNEKIETIETMHKDAKELLLSMIQDAFLDNHKKHLMAKDLIETSKQEILATHKPTDDMKYQLDKKIEIFKVDNEGIVKEIAVLKNQKFVLEKNVENIYTLIERVTKRLDECHK